MYMSAYTVIYMRKYRSCSIHLWLTGLPSFLLFPLFPLLSLIFITLLQIPFLFHNSYIFIFYTPVWKTDVLCRCIAMSVRVCPSVCVSWTFLQHVLIYQFEAWYIHSVGWRTCQIWVSSQLVHFDLVSSQKYIKHIFCNHGLINQDKFFKFVTELACCILLEISPILVNIAFS